MRALSSRVPQADLSLLSFFQVSIRIPSPFGRSQEEMIRLMYALLYPTKNFYFKDFVNSFFVKDRQNIKKYNTFN